MAIRPEKWLQQVFSSPAQIEVLRVLASDPSNEWTQRSLAKEAGLPASTTQLVCTRLRDLRLLDFRTVGPSLLVRLRPDLELTSTIREMFVREALTLQRCLESLRAEIPQKVTVYLFGSTARAEAGESSDIDLLVVAKEKSVAEETAYRLAVDFEHRIPSKVHMVPLSSREARSPRFQRLIQDVLRDGYVVGGPALKEVVTR